MRIAVNTRLLIPGRLEGIGNFAHEILSRLCQQHPEHEFLFLFDRTPDSQFKYASNVTFKRLLIPSRHPFLYNAYFDLELAWALRQWKADIYFSPDGYLSKYSPCPQIPVFHDLNFEHRPKDLPALDRWHYRSFFPKYAKWAKHIVTVSDYSKNDLMQSYAIEEEKITVCYNGIKSRYQPGTQTQREESQQKWAEGQPFFLYVGSLHARKNILGLLKGYENYASQSTKPLTLCIAGANMWSAGEEHQFLQSMKHKAGVKFLGRASEDDLESLYHGAHALILPSFFEGFGVPIVEAQQAGVPVICSQTTSMPEVAGDAALFIDPHKHTSISKAMLDLENTSLRNSLIEKGQSNAKRFQWETSAKQIHDLLIQHGQ